MNLTRFSPAPVTDIKFAQILKSAGTGNAPYLELKDIGTSRLAGDLQIFRPISPRIPDLLERGSIFGKGGTNCIAIVDDRPDLLIKKTGLNKRRLRTRATSPEAMAMYELEKLGIRTVYLGIRQEKPITSTYANGRVIISSQPLFRIIMKKIDGVGSKDIIGTKNQPKSPFQHTEFITRRTILDLLRINYILQKNNIIIEDFQFIVQSNTGKVFVNDPSGLSAQNSLYQSRSITNIINSFIAVYNQNNPDSYIKPIFGDLRDVIEFKRKYYK